MRILIKIFFSVFLSLLLVSCSSMQEIKKDNVREIITQKQNQVENDLSIIPSRIKISVSNIFVIDEEQNCNIDKDIDVEFTNSEFSTILDALTIEKNFNFIYDIEQNTKKDTTPVLLSLKFNYFAEKFPSGRNGMRVKVGLEQSEPNACGDTDLCLPVVGKSVSWKQEAPSVREE